MTVRWTPPAVEDLRSIVDYIRRDNPNATRNVAKRIFDSGNCLSDFPELGRPGSVPGTREMTFPGWPYLLVYEIRGEAVVILHVHHGAREWL